MNNPVFRALCAELLQPLAEYDDANPYHEHRDLITRARAALAQPEGEGPSYREVMALRDELDTQGYGTVDLVVFTRVVLSRWGRPAPQPIPVAERLPGEGDCNAEGRCWWFADPIWELGWRSGDDTHWLPHWALLLPQGEAP